MVIDKFKCIVLKDTSSRQDQLTIMDYATHSSTVHHGW